MQKCHKLKLAIVHSHFRPGGVRRVIELATPHLVRALRPPVGAVVLVGGEAPEASWLRHLQSSVAGVPVACSIDPSLGYLAEFNGSPRRAARQVRLHLRQLFSGAAAGDWIVWAHNLGLARNLLLARELNRLCAAIGIALLAHHHDWWFDNRWQRWPEIRRAGFPTIRAAATAIFGSASTRHLAINRADAALLGRHLPRRAAWLPNLSGLAPPPPRDRVRGAHAWMSGQLGDDAPFWLLPCRLLRRKNIAEALLLTRWLRPEAWLATTAGVSSASELVYAQRLTQAARAHHWRLRLGVLSGPPADQPSVLDLLAAAEAVLLTSVQEGFGLPYLEAAAARRPLIARSLPNIAPDLARFGFRFPHLYGEVRVWPDLFDWSAEMRRQKSLFAAWLALMPAACRRLAHCPPWLEAGALPQPIPFSRLTLTAQLEVLALPAARSWEACLPLNPFLAGWRKRAAARRLQITPWPASADAWLSGLAYGRRFARLVQQARAVARRDPSLPGDSPPPSRLVLDFVRERFHRRFLYPLLWSSES